VIDAASNWQGGNWLRHDGLARTVGSRLKLYLAPTARTEAGITLVVAEFHEVRRLNRCAQLQRERSRVFGRAVGCEQVVHVREDRVPQSPLWVDGVQGAQTLSSQYQAGSVLHQLCQERLVVGRGQRMKLVDQQG